MQEFCILKRLFTVRYTSAGGPALCTFYTNLILRRYPKTYAAKFLIIFTQGRWIIIEICLGMWYTIKCICMSRRTFFANIDNLIKVDRKGIK